MGNCNSIRYTGKRPKSGTRLVDSIKAQVAAHEGIKTIKVDNLCDFSGNSDLCLCIVTWNMNGQVSYQDLLELIGSNRKYDLLVVGLQEVPRKNVSLFLQAALEDTHM